MSSKYEEYEHDESNGGFLLGLLVGAAVGAAAAILYAPKSGAETRSQLKELADQKKANLTSQWEQTKGRAADAVNAAREKVDAVAEQTKSVVDGLAGKARDAADDFDEGTNTSADKFQRRI